MSDFLLTLAFLLYLVASAGLLCYGLNCYVLLILFARRIQTSSTRQHRLESEWTSSPDACSESLPVVTTQLPLYNENNVAERVIRAVAAFDYPKDKHQIQILDDSTDGTRERVDRVAGELRDKGIWIDVIRRTDRTGYKAGALQAAMPEARGEFIAIFDADFVPPPDFVKRLLPQLQDPKTGLAQARWGHLNRTDSLLTRAQSVGIDGHFGIEQTARSANHLFLNFNGTAGLWRRECIEDAGGWTADTLTEDLDLSYRAQLKGWHLEYVPDVVAPAEIPDTYTAFKSQQFRWAKGSIQTAIKLMPEVFRSDRGMLAKLQAVFHLCHYFAHPLMLTIGLLALPSLYFLGGRIHLFWLAVFSTPLLFATCGPTLLYVVSQIRLHPEEWPKRVAQLPGLVLVGFGICISNTRAVFEALTGVKSGFVRTPKRGDGKQDYRLRRNHLPLFEILAGAYCAITFSIYAATANYAILPFLSLYIGGFFLVGFSSLREQRQVS